MTDVPTLLLKGLAEGLVLATVEREPARGDQVQRELTALLGQAPEEDVLFPLLTRLHEEGYLRPQGETGATGDPLYRLTEMGQGRLATYRAMPEPFKDSLAHLFELDRPAQLATPDPEPAHGSREQAVGSNGSGTPTTWVPQVLAALPVGPEVMAPYAKVSLNRDPSSHAWVLRVEHHEPASYPGAQACPLAFLYEASKRLLFATSEASVVELQLVEATQP